MNQSRVHEYWNIHSEHTLNLVPDMYQIPDFPITQLTTENMNLFIHDPPKVLEVN